MIGVVEGEVEAVEVFIVARADGEAEDVTIGEELGVVVGREGVEILVVGRHGFILLQR